MSEMRPVRKPDQAVPAREAEAKSRLARLKAAAQGLEETENAEQNAKATSRAATRKQAPKGNLGKALDAEG